MRERQLRNIGMTGETTISGSAITPDRVALHHNENLWFSGVDSLESMIETRLGEKKRLKKAGLKEFAMKECPPIPSDGSFPFHIGCDPEFTMVYQNRAVHALELLHRMVDAKEKAFYSERDLGIKLPSGIFGHDAASRTAELRPLPSKLPREVVANLRSLMEFFSTKTAGYLQALTTSRFEPTGGHIHLEMTAPELWEDGYARDGVIRKMLTMYVPLLAADSNDTRKGRQTYGKLSDIRIHVPKSTTRTIEVRAPSAEWLTTPKIAEATLAYLATCYFEALYSPETFSKYLKQAVPSTMRGLNDLQAIRSASTFLFSKHTALVSKAIRHFKYYPVYKDQIEYILDTKQVLKDKKAVGFDMLRGFDFPEAKLAEGKTKTEKPKPKVFTTVGEILSAAQDVSGPPEILRGLVESLSVSRRIPFDVNGDERMAEVAADLRSILEVSGFEPSHYTLLYGAGDKTLEEPIIFEVAHTTEGEYEAKQIAGKPHTLSPEKLRDFMRWTGGNGIGRYANRGSFPDKAYMIGIPYAWRMPDLRLDKIRAAYLSFMLLAAKEESEKKKKAS